jgi:hypothetical protein
MVRGEETLNYTDANLRISCLPLLIQQHCSCWDPTSGATVIILLLLVVIVVLFYDDSLRPQPQPFPEETSKESS